MGAFVFEHDLLACLAGSRPQGLVIYPAIPLVYVEAGEPLPGERDLLVLEDYFEADVGVQDAVAAEPEGHVKTKVGVQDAVAVELVGEDDSSRDVLMVDGRAEEVKTEFELLKAEVTKVLRIDHLSPAVENDICWPIKGILCGRNDRAVVHVVFGMQNRLKNMFFIVDTGSPATFISLDTFEALGVTVSQQATISLHGEEMIVGVSPARLQGKNLIGADFMRQTGTTLMIDYNMCSVELVKRVSLPVEEGRRDPLPVEEISSFKKALRFLVNVGSVGWGYVKGLTTPNVA